MHTLFKIIDKFLRYFGRCIVLEVDKDKNYTITNMYISKSFDNTKQ